MSEIIEGRSRRPFQQKIGPVEYVAVEKQRALDEKTNNEQYTGGSNFLIETEKRQMENARENQSKQHSLFSNYHDIQVEPTIKDLQKQIAELTTEVAAMRKNKR